MRYVNNQIKLKKTSTFCFLHYKLASLGKDVIWLENEKTHLAV